MNEKYKAKLENLKTKAKEHWPTIASSVVAGVASALAVYYRNEVVKMQTIDPNEYPVIEVHPKIMDDVKNGATLMYREARVGNHYYGQTTTIGWTDELNEEFKTFKETGEVN